MKVPCGICESEAAPFGQAQVLGRFKVHYFRCAACGFVQTEKPYWLAEAYQEALSGLDVGAVSRNLRLAPITQALLKQFFDETGPFVDYGGGTGLFVRLMRDGGFDFRWADKFAKNIFARGFEAEPSRHELLTAFEVFEHLTEPAAEVEQMLRYAPNILFTTVLMPASNPTPGHWWYYGLEHGQHVAFYSLNALECLARRFHLNLCSAGELHLLTSRSITPAQFRRATKRRYVQWTNWRRPKPSLIDADYQRLLAAQATPAQNSRTPG